MRIFAGNTNTNTNDNVYSADVMSLADNDIVNRFDMWVVRLSQPAILHPPSLIGITQPEGEFILPSHRG